MTFNVPILMKHATDKMHNVENFYTEFHQNWPRNLELTGRNFLMFVSKWWVTEPIFTLCLLDNYLLYSHNEFHENRTKGYGVGTRSQPDGRMGASYCIVKNAQSVCVCVCV